MTQYQRPESLPVWAESGDKTQPLSDEIENGWPPSNVPPSRQRFNWILNYLAEGNRYLLQNGIPGWDIEEDYPEGARVQDEGRTWKAKVSNEGRKPSTSPNEWEIWGFENDQVLPRVDSVATVNIAGNNSAYTLTAEQADNGIIVLTGALLSSPAVILPNVGRRYVFQNDTTNGFTITLKTAEGTGVQLEQGKSYAVYCDGNNNVRLVGGIGDTAIRKAVYLAIAGQTQFTVTFEPGTILFVDRQGISVPFAENGGAGITLQSPANANDRVEIYIVSGTGGVLAETEILPGMVSATPPFASGLGTLASPYIITAANSNPGEMGRVVSTITVTGLQPGENVALQDLNTIANGGRFRFSNSAANLAGVLVFDVLFNDTPTSAIGDSFQLDLRIGSRSVYVRHVRGIQIVPTVNTPTITSPTNLATNVPKSPTIITNAFGVSNGTDTHLSTDWQLATDAQFTNLVFQSLNNTTNKTSITVTPELPANTTIYARARHRGTTYGASGWSPTVQFTTQPATTVNKPSIVSPTAGQIGFPEFGPLTSSAFSVSNGSDTHESTDWIIATDSMLMNVVHQSLNNTVNKTSYPIPAGAIQNNTTYFVSCRHKGAVSGFSAYTDVVQFTTAPASGEQSYTTPGTFSFVVPLNMTSISGVGIGAGGGGGQGNGNNLSGAGGGGGALSYANNIPVTPGETLTVVVGAGGIGGAVTGNVPGTSGGRSEIRRGAAVLLEANGGGGGNVGTAGAGGAATFTGAGSGGGNGGAGGAGNSQAAGNGCGGGGAGGYGGTLGNVNGGNGGIGGRQNVASGSGVGGAAGGGASSLTSQGPLRGSGGGGVSLAGQGANGAGAAINAADTQGGRGGSGGGNGEPSVGATSGGNGGLFGGGGGGARAAAGATAANGQGGAVRIVYPGTTRSFPSTNVS